MKPFAWSFSQLTNFEICRKRYGHVNVKRDFKDEDSQASADGKYIHDQMYKRIIKKTNLPPALAYMERTAATFAAAKGEKFGEMKLALNREFEPVGYFDKSVWVRAVIDLLIAEDDVAIIADWKTGKVKEDFTQMGLCAAVLACAMPYINTFKTVLVFTGHNVALPMGYTRDTLPDVWSDLLPRVAKMEKAYNECEFPASEGPLCGWCPVNTCIHWKERG